MGQNNKKYQDETDKIFHEFNTATSRKWLKDTGLENYIVQYLERMASAQNRDDFEKSKLEFKNKFVNPFYEEVVVPMGKDARKLFLKRNSIMDFYGPKKLGSYDDIKKNEHVLNSKFSTERVNENGEKVVNVPLLRIIDDPGELTRIADKLDVDEESLRKYVHDAWMEKKRRELPKVEESIRQQIREGGPYNVGRNTLLKHFENGTKGDFWSKVAPGLLRSTSPDLYASMRRQVATGEGPAGSFALNLDTRKLPLFYPRDGVEQGNKRVAFRNVPGVEFMQDKFRELGSDAFRNVGLAASGAAGAGFKTPVLGPVITGVGTTLTGIGSLFMSKNYPVNLENLKAEAIAGVSAGTIPGPLTYVMGKISQAPGAIRNIARQFMKKTRSGEPLPSVTKQQNIYDGVDVAKSAHDRFVKGDPTMVREEHGRKIGEITDALNKAPNAAAKGMTFTDEQVEQLLDSPEGVAKIKQLLTAPSKYAFSEWNVLRSSPTTPPETRVNYSEALKRTYDNYREAYDEIVMLDPEISKTAKVIGAGGVMLNKAGGYTGPVGVRSMLQVDPNSIAAPSQELADVMKNDPDVVKMWEQGFVPRDNPLQEKLYKEWQELYGEGR